MHERAYALTQRRRAVGASSLTPSEMQGYSYFEARSLQLSRRQRVQYTIRIGTNIHQHHHYQHHRKYNMYHHRDLHAHHHGHHALSQHIITLLPRLSSTHRIAVVIIILSLT